MKKVIILVLSIISLIYLYNQSAKAETIIPNDAIRVRVIANSNSNYDQSIKIKVKEQVEKDMYNLLKDKKNIELICDSTDLKFVFTSFNNEIEVSKCSSLG